MGLCTLVYGAMSVLFMTFNSAAAQEISTEAVPTRTAWHDATRIMPSGYHQHFFHWPAAVLCKGKPLKLNGHFYPDTLQGFDHLQSATDLFGSTNYEYLPCIPNDVLHDAPHKTCDSEIWAYESLWGLHVTYTYTKAPLGGNFFFTGAYWIPVSIYHTKLAKMIC